MFEWCSLPKGSMKQVSLLAAGCQPWNSDVCAASGDRFAYCATLAIYIYQLDRRYHEFKLHSIMSEHKKTITAISWHPKDEDLIASSSSDNLVIVWNVTHKQVVARLENTRNAPSSIGWCLHEKDTIAFIYGRGPLFLWNFLQSGSVSTHKDISNFMSDVCQFRWHPKKLGKIAFGHVDGSISVFCPGAKIQKHVMRHEELEGTDEEDPVTSLEWDPLSVEYILISNTHSGIRLVDSEGLTVIMSFKLPSQAIQVHTLAWVSSAPGVFVTGDAQSGVMRVWSVSKSAPLENIRLKKTGFHALHVFTTTPGMNEDDKISNGPSSPSHKSSSIIHGSTKRKQPLPPGFAVCTFLDGGVGLYDMGKRKWSFLRDMGHIETIFDCKFKPESQDLLATASFDGTIKIWDVNTLTALYNLEVTSSPGNEGVIYCLSWAPADLNCVAASTSRNGAFIWDIGKNAIIKRFNEHSKGSVYSVAWNQKDSRRLATCGADGFCIIRQVDGTVLAKYKHPSPVFGCDWSPNNKDMIATGCEDKNVRVYYLPTSIGNSSNDPLRVFSGHKAKVFNVKWSPLRDGLLCSGSDDGTIRIWDYTKDACVCVLDGHSGPVRGLHWNSEIPYLLVSGSWDYSIRVWDVRDGACLDTVQDHGADVYGLTSHPYRPFTLASCSRDSTVRIWSMTPLVQPLEMNILAGRPWDEIICSPERSMTLGIPPLLTGKYSKGIRSQIERGKVNNTKIIRAFSSFFTSPGGSDNFWELISVINGSMDSALSTNYRDGIMHMKHLVQHKSGFAQELEMVKTSRFGAGIGAPSKEDKLKEAADIYIRIGNIQRYCEILVELGEWDKALAVAPGVSMKYWKQLTSRRAKQLLQEEDDQSVPYCVATGNVEDLVGYFTGRGSLQDAMMVATAAYEGNITVPHVSRSKNTENGVDDVDHASLELIKNASDQLSDWYFRSGSPVHAACCHLAVNNCDQAIAKLIRGHEIELAASAGLVLTNSPELTEYAMELLSRRCERLGMWDLGIDLLKTMREPDLPLAKLCMRCASSMAEINDLHTKADLPSIDDCCNEAQKYQSQGNTFKTVMYYLLSSTPELGLEIGLKEVQGRLNSPGWEADDVFPMLQLMGCIQTEKLQQHKCDKYRSDLLILSAYIGALVAARRKYDSVVVPLFNHARTLMKKEAVSLSLSESLVTSEQEAWQTYQAVQQYKESAAHPPLQRVPSMTAELRTIYDSLLAKCGQEKSAIGVGHDLVRGSHLPSHYDVQQSYFDGERIPGAPFFLEDGKSAIPVSDAVMWAKVNPFSPLGSGVRINPF